MMKMKELHNDTSNTSYRKRFSLLQPKLCKLLALVSVGVLCACSLFVGFNRNEDEIKNLKEQLNSIQASLQEKAAARSLVKRDVSEEDPLRNVHQVVKRSSNDVVVTSTTTTQASAAGVTYTRWGRLDCPSIEGTSLVYEGVAASSYYSHTGGGTNILCLNINVTYPSGTYYGGNQGGSYIYGVEYGDSSSSLQNLLDLSLIDGSYRYQNVPCAVCMASGKVDQIMIPASGSCPDSWTEEYTGYIMSESYGNKHSGSFICVDGTPEAVPGSEGNQPGSYLYMSETQCPSLQCAPFVGGRELRCAVCTI